MTDPQKQLVPALSAPNPQQRLQAGLDIGIRADRRDLDALVRRCAVEPDFFVRDMLTWALTRLPADETVPRLVAALDSAVPQELAQALHTLSKIGDRPGPEPHRQSAHRSPGHRGGPQRLALRRRARTR